MAHVHHDLALVLERVDRLLERPQLRVGEIERDAEHRLLIRASPLVGQVADRTELLQPAPLELLVELPDVALDRRPLDAQAELADLLPEDAANLRVQGLESDHARIITAFRASARACCLRRLEERHPQLVIGQLRDEVRRADGSQRPCRADPRSTASMSSTLK